MPLHAARRPAGGAGRLIPRDRGLLGNLESLRVERGLEISSLREGQDRRSSQPAPQGRDTTIGALQGWPDRCDGSDHPAPHTVSARVPGRSRRAPGPARVSARPRPPCRQPGPRRRRRRRPAETGGGPCQSSRPYVTRTCLSSPGTSQVVFDATPVPATPTLSPRSPRTSSAQEVVPHSNAAALGRSPCTQRGTGRGLLARHSRPSAILCSSRSPFLRGPAAQPTDDGLRINMSIPIAIVLGTVSG